MRNRFKSSVSIGQTPFSPLAVGTTRDSYYAQINDIVPQGFDSQDMPNDQPKGKTVSAQPLTAFKEITMDYFLHALTAGAPADNPGSKIIQRGLELPLFISHSFFNVHVEPRTHVTFELYHTSASMTEIGGPTAGGGTTIIKGRGLHQATASIDHIECTQKIKKLLHHPSFDAEITTQRPSRIFRKQVFHYGTGSKVTKIGREMVKFISQSAASYPGDFFSSSLVDADHMDDFFEQTNNLMYQGCQLTGPAVNSVTTIAAIDNRPVIEVYAVNPNQLIYTDEPDEGRAGNLIVR